jgi:hypothetical protein
VSEPDGDWRRFYENEPAQPASRKRNYGWLVATGVAIAVLAVAGWAVSAWWLRPPDYAPVRHIEVVLQIPDTIGDRAKNTEEIRTKAAAADVASIGAARGIIDVRAAYYGTDRGKDLIYVVAMTSSDPSSAAVLEEMIDGSLQGGGSEILRSDVVDAGPLGGWARCGEYRRSGTTQVFCGWADGGSQGMVVWYYAPFEKAKRQLPEIRAAVVRPV